MSSTTINNVIAFAGRVMCAANNGTCHFLVGWIKRDTPTPLTDLAFDNNSALVFTNANKGTLGAFPKKSRSLCALKSPPPSLGKPLTVGDTFALTLDTHRRTSSFYRSTPESGSELINQGIVFTDIIDAESLVPAFLTCTQGIVIDCLDCVLFTNTASEESPIMMVVT